MQTLRTDLLGMSLVDSNICAICASEKELESFFCPTCMNELGTDEAKKIFNEMESVLVAADAGQVASQTNSDVKRQTFVEKFGMLEIPADAELTNPDKAGIKPLMSIPVKIDGGRLDAYVFGVPRKLVGTKICALIQLKTKNLQNKKKKGGKREDCYYIRAQYVEGFKVDREFMVDGAGYDNESTVRDLDWSIGKRNLSCRIGFAPVNGK